jgi:hypothetical protein
VTSDYYKGMLNSLYTSLADGVGDDDIKKMQILGFKNPSAFKPVVDDPKLNGNGQENNPSAGNDTGIPLDQDPRS